MGDIELAEICGIHAGDGHLRNKNHNRELDVSGSLEEEIYYRNIVIPLFSKVFRTVINGRIFPKRSTYGFVIREKKIIEKMHSLGFPYGRKSYIVSIPKFIMKTQSLQIKCAFLRGLVDTDGSLSFKRSTGKYREFKRTCHYYPVINLTTTSKSLFDETKDILNSLEIRHCSDIVYPQNSKWSNAYRIWITGGRAIKWMNMIGMNNHVKSSRYDIWMRYGHCPPNTTYAERLSILRKEIKIEKGPVWQPG